MIHDPFVLWNGFKVSNLGIKVGALKTSHETSCTTTSIIMGTQVASKRRRSGLGIGARSCVVSWWHLPSCTAHEGWGSGQSSTSKCTIQEAWELPQELTLKLKGCVCVFVFFSGKRVVVYLGPTCPTAGIPEAHHCTSLDIWDEEHKKKWCIIWVYRNQMFRDSILEECQGFIKHQHSASNLSVKPGDSARERLRARAWNWMPCILEMT